MFTPLSALLFQPCWLADSTRQQCILVRGTSCPCLGGTVPFLSFCPIKTIHQLGCILVGANGATLFSLQMSLLITFAYRYLCYMVKYFTTSLDFWRQNKATRKNVHNKQHRPFLEVVKSPLDYFVSLNTLQLIAFWADVHHHPLLDGVQTVQSYIKAPVL